MPVATIDLAIAFAVTFFAAAIQGTVGMGFAIVSVPFLSIVDPRLAPVPQLLLSIPLIVTMAYRERQHIEFRGLRWILAGRVPGALIGLALLKIATETTLSLMIAGIVLVAVGMLAFGAALPRSPKVDFLAGTFSGISSLISTIGGPPMALLFSREKPPTIRANMAALFIVGLTITLITRLAAGEVTRLDAKVAAILLPALAGGFLMSTRLAARLPQSKARAAILWLSAGSALALAVRTIVQ